MKKTRINAEDQRQKTRLAGKALLQAKSAFAKEYILHRAMTEPCDDATGFRLLELFRKEIQTYVFYYKRGADPGVKHAANEMFRLVAVNEATYTRDEIHGFVRWYDDLTGRIANAIDDLCDFHGDSFNDLCDSLPLAGEAIVKKCLDTAKGSVRGTDKFQSDEDIAKEIEVTLGKDWRRFICDGENYVEMALENQAMKWFLIDVRRDEKLCPEEEYESFDYCDHFDND